MLLDCLLFLDDFLNLIVLCMPLYRFRFNLIYLRTWRVRCLYRHLMRFLECFHYFRLLVVDANLLGIY